MLNYCHSDICQLWIEKYRPKNISELAVHSKKVQEVVTWFEGTKGNEILLLTGPAGSGKSACVEALPNISILSWNSGDVTSFTDFILRSSRYEVLNNSDMFHKKLILIDTLPNTFYEEASQLQEILISYKSLGKCPLIIILSDSPILKYSQYSLIPKTLQQQLNIKSISFNPVTITLMKKTLSNIIKNECTFKIKENRLQEIITDIYNKSGGDIRNAINNLQVFFSGMKNPNQDFSMTKDVHLFIFRALGKILYSKRETDENAIAINNKKILLLSQISPDKLRAPLLFNPEEVFENCGLESSTFVNYLHENFIDFIEDIHQISFISEYFSYTDEVFGQWSTDHYKLAGDYSVSLVSRSIAFYNQSKSKNTWRPLKKSPLVDISKKVAQLQADVIDVISVDSSILKPLEVISTKQALMYTIPYSKIIKRSSLISKMYKNIFEGIQFCKQKKTVGSFLEDNIPEDSSRETANTGFMLKRCLKEQLWTVCKDMNEENVIIEIND